MSPALPGSRVVNRGGRRYLEMALATGRFHEAIRRLAQTVRAAFAPLVAVIDRDRARHGAGNMAGDGSWQSDLCAAWVHGSCPVPWLCDCTCHGGPVR